MATHDTNIINKFPAKIYNVEQENNKWV
jgi:hypothetical protein